MIGANQGAAFAVSGGRERSRATPVLVGAGTARHGTRRSPSFYISTLGKLIEMVSTIEPPSTDALEFVEMTEAKYIGGQPVPSQRFP